MTGRAWRRLTLICVVVVLLLGGLVGWLRVTAASVDAATAVGFFVEDERKGPAGHSTWLTASRANLISQQCDVNGERCETVWQQPEPDEHCSASKIR